jgi:FkbM family methyltransferase
MKKNRFAILFIKIVKRIKTEFFLILWNVNKLFRKTATIKTKQGKFTILFADNAISKYLYIYGEHELDLVSKSLGFLRSIDKCPSKGKGTLLDIGANNGVISIGALLSGEMESSVAIEPEPLNYSMLLRNVEQNNLKDKINCLPFAASEKRGEIQFELSEDNYGDHRVHKTYSLKDSSSELYNESERHIITVEADLLDNLIKKLDILAESISIIWIDVQGFEGFVFMGAKDILTRDIPVMCEIWPYGIRRSGMSHEQFFEIVESIWSRYCVMRRGRYVIYPISMFKSFFDELGNEDDFDNVIFIK